MRDQQVAFVFASPGECLFDTRSAKYVCTKDMQLDMLQVFSVLFAKYKHMRQRLLRRAAPCTHMACVSSSILVQAERYPVCLQCIIATSMLSKIRKGCMFGVVIVASQHFTP